MAQQDLPPPPQATDPLLTKWLYTLWRRVLEALTEIPTSDHTTLSNLNSTDYSHLTAAQLSDLTDSGTTTLHSHDHAAQTNLNSATYYHLTQAQFLDLTDGGETTLHTHSTGMPPAHTHAGADITSTVSTATYATSIPVSATTGTLVASDAGKCISLSAGITVPANIFTAGQAVSLYNNTAGGLTITQGSDLTLHLVGTATTGNRILAQRGMATVWFLSATVAVISGGGLV